MSTPWKFPSPPFRREFAVLVALAILGAGLRAWNLGRLGLNHFDEGIYAFAGLWAFSPHGLADLDPALIPYAPPGFAVLVGLMYSLLGVSDTAAILVSIVMGSATIVVVGLIGRRTFGPGGGVASAAIATFAGPHIAFSRMALCDVSFLFFWLIAIWQGQRFLERPNGVRALALGVAVGLAQLFKYSGWIAGLIVIVTAVLQMVIARDWSRERLSRVWGWGLVAAAIALLVYTPWILFVQNHGGYAALLAHQRGYTGGLRSWPSHLGVQIGQEMGLSGGLILPVLACFASTAGIFWAGKGFSTRRIDLMGFAQVLAIATPCSFFIFMGWGIIAALLGILLLLVIQFKREPLAVLIFHPAAPLVVGWIVLSDLTPFYHPYARLWLPVEAFGWLCVGWMILRLPRRFVEALMSDLASQDAWPSRLRWRAALSPLICLGVVPLLFRHGPSDLQSVYGPSDSLRTACGEVARFLPRDVRRVVVLARPSALFYLSTAGLPIERQSDLEGFARRADGRAWGIVDAVQLNQEGVASLPDKKLGEGWSVERVIPSIIPTATLFDVDPWAAFSRGTRVQVNAEAPLYLLKPTPAGKP